MSKQSQQRYVKEREKQLQGSNNKNENCSNSTSNYSNLSDCSNTTQKQGTKNKTNQ